MSAYATVQTQFRDQQALVQALGEIGYAEVEVHAEAQALYGYHGDVRPEKAHVIVRRQHVGQAANDVGFVRGQDGTFQAIVSAYAGLRPFTAEKQKQLRQRYACCALKVEAAKNGWKVAETKLDDGRVKLTVRR